MKNLYKILVVFFCISLNARAQWFQQTSGTTEVLYSVFFVDDLIGYVVGGNGTILKTVDGGNNWISQTTGTSKNLYSVYFFNANKGFAVGGSGIILNTTDGGTTWNPQYISSDYLSDIIFTSDSIGFIASEHSILKSVDGGNNWIYSSLIEFGGSISFPDATIGYESGCGEFQKTINGGVTWTFIHSNDCLASEPALHDVFFSDSNTGYKVGGGDHSGLISRTTDGGINWNTLDVLDGVFYSVFFTSTDTGYAVGQMTYPQTGVIVNTVDGKTWNIQTDKVTQRLNSVYFPSKKIGYCVGRNGTILKTVDGGGPLIERPSENIFIYPNPCRGYANLIFPENWNTKTIELKTYNIIGKEVKRVKYENQSQAILNVEDFSNGVYTYEAVENTEIIARGKLIIQ